LYTTIYVEDLKWVAAPIEGKIEKSGLLAEQGRIKKRINKVKVEGPNERSVVPGRRRKGKERSGWKVVVGYS